MRGRVIGILGYIRKDNMTYIGLVVDHNVCEILDKETWGLVNTKPAIGGLWMHMIERANNFKSWPGQKIAEPLYCIVCGEKYGKPITEHCKRSKPRTV